MSAEVFVLAPNLLENWQSLVDFCREQDAQAVLIANADQSAGLSDAIAGIQALDCAVLIQGDVELLGALQGDGLHTNSLDQVEQLRAALGDDLSLGYGAQERHDAMEAAEKGADYILFDQGRPDLVAWWVDLMEVPCVGSLDAPGDFVLKVFES